MPDRIDIEAGADPLEVRVYERRDWDDVVLLEDWTASVDDTEVLTAGTLSEGVTPVTPVASGRTTLRITVDGENLDVPVRVGPSWLFVDGNSPAWIGWDTASNALVDGGSVEESAAESAPTVRRVGDRIYLVYSGGFGEVDASSLIVLDAATLEVVAAHEEFAATGAWDIAVIAPDDVVLVGPGDGLLRMNPETGDIAETIALDDGDLEAPVTFASGASVLVLDHLLVIANSAIDRSDFSYAPGQLLLWNFQGEADEEADNDPRLFDGYPDGDTERRPWLPLPTGCVNPSTLVLDAPLLHVQCTGNFGDQPGGVATVDLTDLSAKAFVAVDGAVGSMVVDTFRGEAILSSAVSVEVAVVDLVTGERVLDFDETRGFVTTTQGFFDATTLRLEEDGRVLLVNTGRGALYAFFPEELDAGDPIEALLEIAPSSLGSPQHLVPLRDAREALPLDAATVTVIHPSPGEGFSNPDNLLGPPSGGGYFAPNFSSEDLTTVPADTELTLWLQGVALVDGPGDDLVIFENVLFLSGDRFRRAVDPARVSFSADGVTWVDYPTEEDDTYAIGGFAGGFATDARRYVSGFVGIQPTWANAETNRIPLESRAAGGDRFDLSRVGLPEVRAIRIIADHESGGQPDIDSVTLLNWRAD